MPPSIGTHGVPIEGVLDGQPPVLASVAASAPLLDAPELLLPLAPELVPELLYEPLLDPLAEPLLDPDAPPFDAPLDPELLLKPELLLDPDALLDAPPDPPPPAASSPESDVPEVELELPHATTSAERIANVGFLTGPPCRSSVGHDAARAVGLLDPDLGAVATAPLARETRDPQR